MQQRRVKLGRDVNKTKGVKRKKQLRETITSKNKKVDFFLAKSVSFPKYGNGRSLFSHIAVCSENTEDPEIFYARDNI